MQTTQAAEPKTIDLDAIQDMAKKAGMTASELLEWGLYTLLETYREADYHPSDAGEELKTRRRVEGKIPDELIPSNPLTEFAADAGIHCGELNELALLTAFNILNCSEYPDAQPKDILEDLRREQGPLTPNFQHDRVNVHPFMAALFSGERVSGKYSPPEKLTNGQFWVASQLGEIMEARHFTECDAVDIFSLFEAIKHNPELKQEAAAMLAFYESQQILQAFAYKAN